MAETFKPGDRVVRRDVAGPEGTVQKIREERIRETLRESTDGDEPLGITVTVLWDNGTASHFVPDALQKL
ncbi:MAG: hypothetical protein KDD44_06850 [Bdellovibrionales bacterium]|nr:hypothetical protein [Bdellovibrionales bacterium]